MSAALAEVLARADIWRGDRLACAPLPVVASGFGELDVELPGGGWPRGALIELLAHGSGLGEVSLLLPALRAVREEGDWSLLVAPPHPLHAPAWAAGADLSRLAVVSPATERDALWAMEQALTSGAPGLVLGWASYADARALRRLQVAAAAGRALALLFRPLHAIRDASPAPLRLVLAAGVEGRLSVRILKRRGPPLAMPLDLALPRPVRSYSHGRSLARHSSAVAACA
jgi:cell division inhibitor SulA